MSAPETAETTSAATASPAHPRFAEAPAELGLRGGARLSGATVADVRETSE
ncbi:hypothetical protein ACFYT7_12885 [Streptomyces sp. NPDC004041]|uniref:hypothetical protein n=1 Tax=Streptomyces sp. NPDC004041 TaxID=3364688 RepID=UPI0036C33982